MFTRKKTDPKFRRNLRSSHREIANRTSTGLRKLSGKIRFTPEQLELMKEVERRSQELPPIPESTEQEDPPRESPVTESHPILAVATGEP